MKSIIWAIDPAELSLAPKRDEVAKLKTWAQALRLEVHPLHVLSPSEITSKHDGARKLADQRQSLANYLAAVSADFTTEPVVLVAQSGGRSSAIDCLLKFARAQEAGQIAVSSHGRSGASRVVMGSFAEMLLARSEVPVLFLSHSEGGGRISSRRVLFATDFSDPSKLAFRRMLQLCKKGGADVILFHRLGLTPAMEAAISGAGTFALLPDHYFEEQRAWAERETADSVKIAAEHGVKIRPLILEDRRETSKLILDLARRSGASLIGLASRRGPVETALLGSVSRGVFRAHGVPVWVCGPGCNPASANPEGASLAGSA